MGGDCDSVQPEWQIINDACAKGTVWKLVIRARKADVSTVDLAEDVVRLCWLSKWWSISVPPEAQPLHDAKCRFRRNASELVVEWEGTSTRVFSEEVNDDDHTKDGLCSAKPGGRCDVCGKRAAVSCSRCKLSLYCTRDCQKRHWVAGHKCRCRLSGGLLAAKRQLQRGEAALSLSTAEEAMKAHSSAIKAEAEKEYAFEYDVVAALSRGLATAFVYAAKAVAAEKELANDKFCRACFAAVACMLDLAAALKQERCPKALWTQAEALAAGLGDQPGKDSDPILSAWMLYDSYAKGLADRPSAYASALPQMRIVALLALRDMLSASAGLLEDEAEKACFADACVVKSASTVLRTNHLKICREDLGPLREYYPPGILGRNKEEDDTILPWHKF
mmetsp:Transcript_39472/g.91243  ORF Transcript_39472/g.91243 Transcript_39472/m.91243 type:complete len:391 (+) Transcript_39472:166-1338(+)